jgi:hypothetical protein
MNRIDTPRGPVFVRSGARDRAVVYVHGYYDTAASVAADIAKRVPEGATLIIPEAPSSASASVNFPSLPELLLAAGVPGAEVVAVGHSGAYRTLLSWLSAPALRELVLLDALYGGESAFEAWARQPGHRIVLAGLGEPLAKRLGATWLPVSSHYGALDLIPGILRDSPLLGGISVAAVAVIAVSAYMLYRWWLK